MDNFGILSADRGPIGAIKRGWIRFLGTRMRQGDESLFDRLGARIMRRGEKSVADAGSGADSMAIYRPGGSQTVPASKAMDSHFGWVYACVKAISDEMANIQFRLFQIDSEGEHEEVPEHDLLDLLEGVNERQTGPEFRKTLAAHLELTGNAYLYLFGVKDADAKPKAMYLLNPGRVRVMIDRTSFPYQVKGYEMVDQDRKFTFQPYEIVHFKYPDPSNQEIGLGTVQGIAEWIDNDNYAMEFNRNFFRNGARMSGVFETDMTSIDQMQRLKTAFEEQFAGVRNAWKSMMMPKGVKWTPTQATSKDMDYANLLDMTAERILAGFRVSRTILGTAESDTNRATAETADYVFAKRTIKPKMEMIVSTFNEFVVPRFGEDIYLGFNDPVPEDKQFRTMEMQAAVANKQVMTQNEARAEFLGLGPVEDESADKLASAAPAPAFGKPDPGEPPKKKPEDEDEDGDEKRIVSKRIVRSVKYSGVVAKRKGKARFKTQFSRNKEIRKSMAKSLAEMAAAAVKEIMGRKDVVTMTDDEYLSAVWTHSKARMDDYEPKLRAAIAGVADRQERTVLQNLNRAIKSRKDVDQSKLFDMPEWIGITVGAVEPIMAEFFSREFIAAAQAAGTPEAQISATIAESLKARMELLGRSYNETVIEALSRKLDDGISAGFSRAALADSVREIYAWSRTYQAERIAKTETVAVSNMANKSAWQAGGRVRTLRWYTSLKDNVCPFCQAMAGTVVDVNQNFLDLGQEFTAENGETMTADYSAVSTPPLHPNCGCLVRPDSFNPAVSLSARAGPTDAEAAIDDINKTADEQ